MKLIIDISEYDREWIKNTYGIPQDIDVAIARAIINGKKLHDHHGRIVDADEIWEKMYRYSDNEGAKMPYGDDDSLIHKDSACFLIENAPTIVESEYGE